MIINHSEIHDNRVAVVEIDGPLDSVTSPGFEEYINKLLERNLLFILFDSGKMKYVSSEGIGLLLFLQRKIYEANGFFVIFNLPHEIMTLYTLLGFDKVFRIAGDRAEAIQVMDRQMELRAKGLRDEPPPEPAPAVTAAAVPQAGPEPVEEVPPLSVKPLEERKKDGEAAVKEAPAEQRPGTRIMECSHCRSLVRVSRDGNYLCPHCNREFAVKSSEAVRRPAEPSVGGFGSIIVECKTCRSLIRIKKAGSYRCPDCKTAFSVGADQTVKF
ncbi:MAG TPA: STAS domain-containing protein [Spirochaetota bacterium]|nr:STAS domain-containing protein [Spirochaetota bacterium]HPC42828.1 STAS domain-containing protein [Spirochaetota bacterium]HPL17750.1 STAS domain-containing protein [Spirochaetota bacterium]HQF10283.1 STAS domain-containing protein [Spirochaetota bacterium]HQH99161.1 STAS domain-containing protein [Spirochaetota bacterium]